MLENLKGMSTESIISEIGVLKHGHTVFTNHLHGNGYVSKDGLLTKPNLTMDVARRVGDLYEKDSYDFIVGPVNFGAQFAALVAVNVNKPFTMAHVPFENNEYIPSNGRLHRDFDTNIGNRVLLIDDWAVTSETIQAYSIFLSENDFKLVGFAGIGSYPSADESMMKLKISTKTLIKIPFTKNVKNDCNQCNSMAEIKFNNVRE
jgi:adenine/guanine phosphoribosyltransferase-like PRPP-binding protein